MTSACHAEDHGFESRTNRHSFYGSVAQLVEHRTENPGVGGSIPLGATINYFRNVVYALVAQLDRVFGYEPKGQGFESLRAHHYREMAQLGRALGLGPRGCRFKSCFPDHLLITIHYVLFFFCPKQSAAKISLLIYFIK